MALQDLKDFALGLATYKSNLVAVLDTVNKEINRQEDKRRREPTTAEKFNSKYSWQRTGGQRWGSFFFAWLE